MSRYDKLSEFLGEQIISAQRMTFREVEKVLGFPLPNSAYKYPAWWANDPNPSRHSYAWLSVGWETEELDLAGEKVTFRRTGVTRAADPSRSGNKAMAQSAKRNPALSSEELLFADTPAVKASVDVKWLHLGTLARDASGDLAFPSAPIAPGLNRFRLKDGDSSRHYIGETTELRRRFQHYSKPGPAQATNVRVNALLKEHLESGGGAEVDIIVDGVVLMISGEKVDADLSDKATRRLLENAALVAEGGTEIELLNR